MVAVARVQTLVLEVVQIVVVLVLAVLLLLKHIFKDK
jgi:hypothetical protein